MSLRRYFHPTIWSRGQEYYHSDLVTDFKAEGTHFSAKVQGTRPYDVMLNVSGDNLYKARCSCPYAADGSYCKHEAALAARVQFYLGHERRISAVTVHPFGSDPKDDRKDRSGFFDLDVSCKRLEVKEDDLTLAERAAITAGSSTKTRRCASKARFPTRTMPSASPRSWAENS